MGKSSLDTIFGDNSNESKFDSRGNQEGIALW
jgi:hypothetical protein